LKDPPWISPGRTGEPLKKKPRPSVKRGQPTRKRKDGVFLRIEALSAENQGPPKESTPTGKIPPYLAIWEPFFKERRGALEIPRKGTGSVLEIPLGLFH